MLYLAIKYLNDPGRALGVNAALSGDNCNRGSLLGAILGCAGARLPEYLTKGLYQSDKLASRIGSFKDSCVASANTLSVIKFDLYTFMGEKKLKLALTPGPTCNLGG